MGDFPKANLFGTNGPFRYTTRYEYCAPLTGETNWGIWYPVNTF